MARARAYSLATVALVWLAGGPALRPPGFAAAASVRTTAAAGQPPSVSLAAAPASGAAPLTASFFVSARDPAGAGFVSYFWNFGDGQAALRPSTVFAHTYVKPGNYLATVTATTTDGRSATAFTGVIVRSAQTR
ncbi:MAG: PKD domain-containing protein [Deltaproteobacteria bacterium]|nr:PKD domain-containing protein [Deltaproteobacteria bacterium]